jgi:hypothetical protein
MVLRMRLVFTGVIFFEERQYFNFYYNALLAKSESLPCKKRARADTMPAVGVIISHQAWIAGTLIAVLNLYLLVTTLA